MAIVRPQRQVTRFFIPLIDVLILLFCIFLLMPFVSTQGVGQEGAEGTRKDQRAAEELATLHRRLDDLQAKLDEATKDRQEMLSQLSVRVLEIDARDGQLYFKGSQNREGLKSDADAERYIYVQKMEARQQEVYFLILYPRELTGYPTEAQRRRYESWFAQVPHSFSRPVGDQ